jgi:hypothetical protein
MKKLIIGSLIAATAIVCGPHQSASAGPYGAAGCGLGSIVFGNSGGIIQILAATTNGFLGSQTFGITSGTSNCADTGGGASSAHAFIQTNREALAKDISRGNGETIKNLATLGGCGDAAAVGATLQKNFKTIFPTADVSNVQVSDNVITVLKSEPSLSCQRLI